MAARSASRRNLSGEVEADETFVGGVSRTSWKGQSGFVKLAHGPATGKATVSLQGADGKHVTYKALTSSHPRWRLQPGRVARAAARRAITQAEPIQRPSDRI